MIICSKAVQAAKALPENPLGTALLHLRLRTFLRYANR